MHVHPTRRAVLAAALGTASAPLFAQEPSGRVLKLVTPFPPGGGLGVVARYLATALQERLGRPVIVDTRTGGNAIVGARTAASAAPDGDTLFLGTNSSMVTNPAVMSPAPYHPLVDFAPVARVVGYETVVLVHPDSRFKSLGDLIAEGKRPGSRINFGASTTTYHVALERLKKAGGFEAAAIPYKGTVPALTDLMGGQIDVTMGDLGSITALVKAGRLRVLAVNSAKRSLEMPDVPSLAEFGIPGVEIYAWVGGFYQAKVDPAVVQAMAEAMLAVMKTPAAHEVLKANGANYYPAGTVEFRKFLTQEIELTKNAADAAGIRIS